MGGGFPAGSFISRHSLIQALSRQVGPTGTDSIHTQSGQAPLRFRKAWERRAALVLGLQGFCIMGVQSVKRFKCKTTNEEPTLKHWPKSLQTVQNSLGARWNFFFSAMQIGPECCCIKVLKLEKGTLEWGTWIIHIFPPFWQTQPHKTSTLKNFN